jgi:hypothetical protein
MIPNNLKYQSKVESAPARRYRTNIQPQNGSGTSTSGYGPNSTITINIPTRNNTALIPSESTLKGAITFTTGSTAGHACGLDSMGHHGWINRLRIFHGSNLLQDIQNYGDLAKILYDFQAPLDSTQGRYSVTTGTTNEYTGQYVSGTSANFVANGIVVKPVNRGKNLIPPADSATPNIPATSTKTERFSINLIALVGALAGGKYLPLWQMTSAPLRVEIVLQPSIVNAMVIAPSGAVPTTGGTGNYTIHDVEYIGEFLELPDSAISAIESGSSSPMQMVFPDWRAYQSTATLQNAVTNVTMPIPAKFSSLKSIVVNSKLSNGGAGLYPSSSVNFNLQSYQFRVGSEVLPSNPPNSVDQYFTEAIKCFGSVADTHYQPSIDIDSYNLVWNDAQTDIGSYLEAVTANSGSFLVGLDLESYQNTDKSSIFAGMNTNTSDIFFQPVFGATQANLQCNMCAFANFDSVLVCENGVAYVRF